MKYNLKLRPIRPWSHHEPISPQPTLSRFEDALRKNTAFLPPTASTSPIMRLPWKWHCNFAKYCTCRGETLQHHSNFSREVGVSLFAAVAVFGEVVVSLFVTGTVLFGEFSLDWKSPWLNCALTELFLLDWTTQWLNYSVSELLIYFMSDWTSHWLNFWSISLVVKLRTSESCSKLPLINWTKETCKLPIVWPPSKKGSKSRALTMSWYSWRRKAQARDVMPSRNSEFGSRSFDRHFTSHNTSTYYQILVRTDLSGLVQTKRRIANIQFSHSFLQKRGSRLLDHLVHCQVIIVTQSSDWIQSQRACRGDAQWDRLVEIVGPVDVNLQDPNGNASIQYRVILVLWRPESCPSALGVLRTRTWLKWNGSKWSRFVSLKQLPTTCQRHLSHFGKLQGSLDKTILNQERLPRAGSVQCLETFWKCRSLRCLHWKSKWKSLSSWLQVQV